jgi:hypothetical protein
LFNSHYETFDPDRDICDVYVWLPDGRKFVATLPTLAAIESVMKTPKATGDGPEGHGFGLLTD